MNAATMVNWLRKHFIFLFQIANSHFLLLFMLFVLFMVVFVVVCVITVRCEDLLGGDELVSSVLGVLRFLPSWLQPVDQWFFLSLHVLMKLMSIGILET